MYNESTGQLTCSIATADSDFVVAVPVIVDVADGNDGVRESTGEMAAVLKLNLSFDNAPHERDNEIESGTFDSNVTRQLSRRMQPLHVCNRA